MYDNQYMYGRNSFNDRPSRKQKKEQKKSQKKKKKSNPFGRGFINSEDVEPFQMSEKDKKFWNELSSKTTTKPKDWETEKATNDVFEPIRQVAEHLTRVPRTKPPHLAWFENVGKMRDWYLESLAQGSPLSDATEPLAQANCSKCIMQKSVSINAFYLTRHVSVVVKFCSCKGLVQTLMMMQLMPASFERPRSAVHFGLLQSMQNKNMASLSW